MGGSAYPAAGALPTASRKIFKSEDTASQVLVGVQPCVLHGFAEILGVEYAKVPVLQGIIGAV